MRKTGIICYTTLFSISLYICSFITLSAQNLRKVPLISAIQLDGELDTIGSLRISDSFYTTPGGLYNEQVKRLYIGIDKKSKSLYVGATLTSEPSNQAVKSNDYSEELTNSFGVIITVASNSYAIYGNAKEDLSDYKFDFGIPNEKSSLYSSSSRIATMINSDHSWNIEFNIPLGIKSGLVISQDKTIGIRFFSTDINNHEGQIYSSNLKANSIRELVSPINSEYYYTSVSETQKIGLANEIDLTIRGGKVNLSLESDIGFNNGQLQLALNQNFSNYIPFTEFDSREVNVVSKEIRPFFLKKKLGNENSRIFIDTRKIADSVLNAITFESNKGLNFSLIKGKEYTTIVDFRNDAFFTSSILTSKSVTAAIGVRKIFQRGEFIQKNFSLTGITNGSKSGSVLEVGRKYETAHRRFSYNSNTLLSLQGMKIENAFVESNGVRSDLLIENVLKGSLNKSRKLALSLIGRSSPASSMDALFTYGWTSKKFLSANFSLRGYKDKNENKVSMLTTMGLNKPKFKIIGTQELGMSNKNLFFYSDLSVSLQSKYLSGALRCIYLYGLTSKSLILNGDILAKLGKIEFIARGEYNANINFRFNSELSMKLNRVQNRIFIGRNFIGTGFSNYMGIKLKV